MRPIAPKQWPGRARWAGLISDPGYNFLVKVVVFALRLVFLEASANLFGHIREDVVGRQFFSQGLKYRETSRRVEDEFHSLPCGQLTDDRRQRCIDREPALQKIEYC